MDPYAEQESVPTPRRRSRLWGCLGVLIAAAAVVAVVFGFGARHFFGLLDRDSQVQIITDALNKSDEATSALGGKITVLSRTRQTYSAATGRGQTMTYVLKVVGPNGEGEAKAELDMRDGEPKITALVLKDAEGRPHYIIGNRPPNPMIDNSI